MEAVSFITLVYHLPSAILLPVFNLAFYTVVISHWHNGNSDGSWTLWQGSKTSTWRTTNGNAMQITEENSVCMRTDDGWLLSSFFHCVKISCIQACSLYPLVFAARIFHSGDYLAELHYHVCTDTLGPPNLVNSEYRKLCPLDIWSNKVSQTFNAYQVGENSTIT